MLFEPRDRNFLPRVHCFVVRQAMSLQLFDNHGCATHPRPRIVKSPRATGTMFMRSANAGIIDVLSSTKNATKARYPEMH